MEVILTLLLCALGFFIYLTNKNKNEILLLRNELRDKDIEIESLRNKINSLENLSATSSHPKNFYPQLPQPSGIFVSVIFRQGDKKYYDYFVGDNDVKVGDFVEVYFNNKSSGKVERHTAQVIYVSKPGEVSEFARSKIKRKADYPKW